MAGYGWLVVGRVVAAGLYLARRYDRRMAAQGRSVRSSGNMGLDGRSAKSDARAFGSRAASPTSAADFATKVRRGRQTERE